jgi:hypothetical protein
MDTREHYRDIIEQVLIPYAERRYSGEDITNEAVFDRERGRFIVASVGWQGYRRVQQNLLHIDLVGDKVWIQRDGTEDGIAGELEAAGIPKSQIVLAFHRAEDRALLPEYAIA